MMSGKFDEINVELVKVFVGGGFKYVDWYYVCGNLILWECIELFVDLDFLFLELSLLVVYGSNFQIGVSLVIGIGVVCGVECMIVVNDLMVKGGISNLWMF